MAWRWIVIGLSCSSVHASATSETTDPRNPPNCQSALRGTATMRRLADARGSSADTGAGDGKDGTARLA